MSITRKLAKLILTLLTLPLLVVVWLLKWFVMFLYCCSAWIFYLLGSVLFATAVLSFLMKQSQGMEALQMPERMANRNRPLPVCLQKNCMPIPAIKSW